MNDSFDPGPSRDFLSRAFLSLPHPWAAYRLVTDDTGEPLDAVVLEANAAFSAQLGLTPEATRGMSVREIMAGDPAGADSRIELFGRVTLDRQTLSFEEYFAETDTWMGVTVTSPEYLRFVTLAFDITDRKKAEIREREGSALLRTVMDSAPVAIFVADSEGRYLDVNAAAGKMLDFSREELLARSIPDLVPPARIEESFRAFETLKTSGAMARETKLCRKDGTTVDVSLRGVPLDDGTYLAFCQDLAETKRADRGRDRFLSAFMAVDRPIFILDQDGAFIEANDRFLALYGFARDSLGSLDAGFLDPGMEACRALGYDEGEHESLYQALWRDVRNPSLRAWDGVLPNLRRDGSLFWNHLVMRGLFTVDGILDSVVGFPSEIPTSPLYGSRD